MVEAIIGNVIHLSEFESLHYSCEGRVSTPGAGKCSCTPVDL